MRKFVAALLAVVLGGAIALAVPQLVQAQAAGATDQTGTLTGKAVDSSGNPVGGAIVRVMRIPNGPPHHRGMKPNQVQPGQTVWIKHHMVVGITKTADNGTFTINNAPVGKYRVMVFARGVGRGWVHKPVEVTSGATVDAGTITLQKGHPHHHGPPPGQ